MLSALLKPSFRRFLFRGFAAGLLLGFGGTHPVAAQTTDKWEYVRKETRAETIRATLKANNFPNLEGDWHWIGPFDNTDNQGFDAKLPPETEIDLKKTYKGKDGSVQWGKVSDFSPGRVYNLKKLVKSANDVAIYLYHEFEWKGTEPERMPIRLGSDDGLCVWFNGKELLREDATRPAEPDQNEVEILLTPGKNRLLLKVTNRGGDYAVYLNPEFCKSIPGHIQNQLGRNFAAGKKGRSNPVNSREADSYRIETIPLPTDCVLEVGGLAFRPDGKLLACTRRGEIWLIHNPLEADVNKIKFSRFATGLHEPLGLITEGNNVVYVAQRPELTKLVDTNNDGTADEYITVCDKFGCSGDYHEFVFGPARDNQGNFFLTLNVGFGGGHQSKSAWRGWCVKISPDGKMEPYAYGLRSPNGVNFNPAGDLFYTDNQGEWVASNKMHHIEKGKFFGHQASLAWVKHSPFAGQPDQIKSGMFYDSQKGEANNAPDGYPELSPPCIWFPYTRMGKSVSEPVWDLSSGKFGPFAGQCFVGDQTQACVMRVALEKVNGAYQGACFPFRSGFQCGINRSIFAPDGSLFVGQTNRGWGSLGNKPYGLQRLIYTGQSPFEIHNIQLQSDGFLVQLTDTADAESASKPGSYSLSSYTYAYHSQYGCPEKDVRSEKITDVQLLPDGKSIRLVTPNLRKGRVYEIRLDGVKNRKQLNLVHPEGFYTLNHLKTDETKK